MVNCRNCIFCEHVIDSQAPSGRVNRKHYMCKRFPPVYAICEGCEEEGAWSEYNWNQPRVHGEIDGCWEGSTSWNAWRAKFGKPVLHPATAKGMPCRKKKKRVTATV
jgi:hypothetical protein